MFNRDRFLFLRDTAAVDRFYSREPELVHLIAFVKTSMVNKKYVGGSAKASHDWVIEYREKLLRLELELEGIRRCKGDYLWRVLGYYKDSARLVAGSLIVP